MAKYGDLIRKAREADSQEDNEPVDQLSVKPDDQKTKQPESEEEVASQEHESESRVSGKPDDQTNRQPEKEANLCVKVPVSLRRHWAAEAKRQGITMTEVMVEALTQRFGKPDDQ